MKYISSAMFMGIFAFLFQFYRARSFELQLSPPPGQTGIVTEASAIWMIIPFVISLGLLVFAVIEDVKKSKEINQSKI